MQVKELKMMKIEDITEENVRQAVREQLDEVESRRIKAGFKYCNRSYRSLYWDVKSSLKQSLQKDLILKELSRLIDEKEEQTKLFSSPNVIGLKRFEVTKTSFGSYVYDRCYKKIITIFLSPNGQEIDVSHLNVGSLVRARASASMAPT